MKTFKQFISEQNNGGYQVTSSWTDKGLTYKRWDMDHSQGGPADRHQSSIVMTKERDKPAVFKATHRIEYGYWTNQSSRASPTKETFKGTFNSFDEASAGLENHTSVFYKKP